MRPLVMDFRTDVRAAEYRRPVHVWAGDSGESGHRAGRNDAASVSAERAVVRLLDGREHADGGKALNAAAPLDRLPLYVRAGSIVPMGPDVEYAAAEKPADPIELRVYRGADGDFTLYEDENDNYDYEKGVYATIPLHWDDAGNLDHWRAQRPVPGNVGEPHVPRGICGRESRRGSDPADEADKVVQYSGKQITVTP